ncbi:MAG: carboxymuconolactone decarboxylase family protein [Thalassospira sp.]|uniref:carboxymuconolactone decarboxylase family protein n=1 Tax=Thalassospira sp. TaxID=1912094 RepID=UPI0032EB4DBC
MADFSFHDVGSAPQESKPLLEFGLKAYGRIPVMYAAMAEAPGLLDSYIKVQDLFMASSFTKEEMTVVWQAINVEHECHYCVPGHSFMARSMGVDASLDAALRAEMPLPTPRLEALRSFTLAMLRQRGAVSDAQVDAFLAAGFTRRNVYEVILGLAQKVMSNFTNHIAKTPVTGDLENFTWSRGGP